MNVHAPLAVASLGRAALYLRVSTGRQASTISRFPTSGGSFMPIAKRRALPSSTSLSSREHPQLMIAGRNFRS